MRRLLQLLYLRVSCCYRSNRFDADILQQNFQIQRAPCIPCKSVPSILVSNPSRFKPNSGTSNRNATQYVSKYVSKEIFWSFLRSHSETSRAVWISSRMVLMSSEHCILPSFRIHRLRRASIFKCGLLRPLLSCPRLPSLVSSVFTSLLRELSLIHQLSVLRLLFKPLSNSVQIPSFPILLVVYVVRLWLSIGLFVLYLTIDSLCSRVFPAALFWCPC